MQGCELVGESGTPSAEQTLIREEETITFAMSSLFRVNGSRIYEAHLHKALSDIDLALMMEVSTGSCRRLCGPPRSRQVSESIASNYRSDLQPC